MPYPFLDSKRLFAVAFQWIVQRCVRVLEPFRPTRRSFLYMVQTVAETAFCLGMLSVLAFFAAQTPQEAAKQSLGELPGECEAGFFNHGAYVCWYTVSDHPYLFMDSVAAMLVGAAVYFWAQRRISAFRSAGGD